MTVNKARKSTKVMLPSFECFNWMWAAAGPVSDSTSDGYDAINLQKMEVSNCICSRLTLELSIPNMIIRQAD